MRKNILLVGDSHGIGLEIARNLIEEYTVYVASGTNDQLNDLDVIHIPFDTATDFLEEKQIPYEIHGFVYFPSSINRKPFEMLSIDTFAEDMNLNYFALIKVLKPVIPRMANASSMVFFSAVAVGKGTPFHTSTAGAKGAIEGFAESLAAEYAPKVRINTIAPSLVDTPLAKRLLGNDRKKKTASERHSLKRYSQTSDIANLTIFLLSEKSGWVTGQNLGVDEGASTLNING
ncbi:MAG: SDR family oxidoreductase [Flavobacteriaceae bacterium]